MNDMYITWYFGEAKKCKQKVNGRLADKKKRRNKLNKFKHRSITFPQDLLAEERAGDWASNTLQPVSLNAAGHEAALLEARRQGYSASCMREIQAIRYA